MKQLLINLIENDSSCNKNVTKYLYKTHPELWSEILIKTNFLPSDAKPKQRVWHFMHQIWERPVCIETGKFTQWHENRYLTFFLYRQKHHITIKEECTKIKLQKQKKKEKTPLKIPN
jgi:hypothetical protein